MALSSFRHLQLSLNNGIIAYHKHEIAWLTHLILAKQAGAVAIQAHVAIDEKTPILICAQ